MQEIVTPPTRPRLIGVDAGRFIAVCGLPFMHVDHVGPASNWLDLAFRFSVPFFFIAAGYFLSADAEDPAASIARVVRRLLIPFAVWALVYAVAFHASLSVLVTPAGLADLLLNGGRGYHLWFLPALAVASLMLILLRRQRMSAVVAIAATLYVVALVLGPYASRFGLDGGQVVVRNGALFGFPFMAAGYCLRSKTWRPPSWLAALLFIGGGALQAGEFWALQSSGAAVRSDVLIGTVPFGIGAFMLALKLRRNVLTEALAYLGGHSLGIYALHLMGLALAAALLPVRSLADALASVAISLAFSTLVSLALGRIPLTRALVR